MIFINLMLLSMSIIFGSRSKNRVMGQKVYSCSRCRIPSYHAIVRSQGWFTLYFIPLIPTGKSTISRCNLCGYQEQINNKQADSWFSQDQTGSAATPQKTLEQLMDEGTTHYEAGRYMEAIAAYDQVLQYVPNNAVAYYIVRAMCFLASDAIRMPFWHMIVLFKLPPMSLMVMLRKGRRLKVLEEQ
jgi:tetratricopeptide repeat protein